MLNAGALNASAVRQDIAAASLAAAALAGPVIAAADSAVRTGQHMLAIDMWAGDCATAYVGNYACRQLCT